LESSSPDEESPRSVELLGDKRLSTSIDSCLHDSSFSSKKQCVSQDENQAPGVSATEEGDAEPKKTSHLSAVLTPMKDENVHTFHFTSTKASSSLASNSNTSIDETYSYYTLITLKHLDGVDTSRKEMYLSDEEFQSLFHMDKSEFMASSQWKRDNRKKELGLF
jgi:Villin headpiece domain